MDKNDTYLTDGYEKYEGEVYSASEMLSLTNEKAWKDQEVDWLKLWNSCKTPKFMVLSRDSYFSEDENGTVIEEYGLFETDCYLRKIDLETGEYGATYFLYSEDDTGFSILTEGDIKDFIFAVITGGSSHLPLG